MLKTSSLKRRPTVSYLGALAQRKLCCCSMEALDSQGDLISGAAAYCAADEMAEAIASIKPTSIWDAGTGPGADDPDMDVVVAQKLSPSLTGASSRKATLRSGEEECHVGGVPCSFSLRSDEGDCQARSASRSSSLTRESEGEHLSGVSSSTSLKSDEGDCQAENEGGQTSAVSSSPSMKRDEGDCLAHSVSRRSEDLAGSQAAEELASEPGMVAHAHRAAEWSMQPQLFNKSIVSWRRGWRRTVYAI